MRDDAPPPMDTGHALTNVRSSLRDALHRRLGVDTRALAAFRVALGLLVLADLAARARNVGGFYTDHGVLPRSDLLARSDPLHLSLHAVSGDAWFQVALFLLAGAFAVALAVGYHTRVATVASWILLVSLHNRNELVLNGGDVLLRLLLFFAIFLPLAERWSVDGVRADDGRDRDRVASVATAALLLQVVVMYSTNAAFKLSGELWLRGEALEYVFSLGQFTVLLGDELAAYPAVLETLDYLWLAMVVGSVFLVLLTGLPRTAFVFAFVGAHVGMALTMRLGLFPLISIAGLLPFLPARFWDAAVPRLSRSRLVEPAARLPETLDRALPVVIVRGVPSPVARLARLSATVVPGVFLVVVVLWNVQALGYAELAGHDVLPEEADSAIEVTRTDQYWNMFAPDPLSTDGWVVAPGELSNGSRVDAFDGGTVTWDRPPDVSSSYPSARWRKYLVGLWRYDTGHRERFAAYLCRDWNDHHDSYLVDVSVYFVEQPTRIDGEPEPVERVWLVDHRC